MRLGGIYQESVFMSLTFLLLCKMKIFMECGGEGWWRRMAVFGDGSVGQTVLVLSRLLHFLVGSTG